MIKKLTGREPSTGNGIEPMEIWAHQPKMMGAMGKFNQAVRKGSSVDQRLKNLVELEGRADDRVRVLRRPRLADLAQLWLLRRGADRPAALSRERPVHRAREAGPRLHGSCDADARRSHRRAVSVSMRQHFSDEQLVEITALLTVVNLDRLNAAFGIRSAGFSDGMVCLAAERPAAGPALARIA